MLIPGEMVKSCSRVRAQALFMIFSSVVAEACVFIFSYDTGRLIQESLNGYHLLTGFFQRP